MFGLAYTWIEWLEYNISRTLDPESDEQERRIGIREVKNTLKRIEYIHNMEKDIRQVMSSL